MSKRTSKNRNRGRSQRRIVLVEMLGAIPSFNLPHDPYCLKSGACNCSSGEIPKLDRDTRGNYVRSSVRRRRPKNITLSPHGKSEPLHPAALECEEIRAALNSSPRRIRSEPAK